MHCNALLLFYFFTFLLFYFFTFTFTFTFLLLLFFNCAHHPYLAEDLTLHALQYCPTGGGSDYFRNHAINDECIYKPTSFQKLQTGFFSLNPVQAFSSLRKALIADKECLMFLEKPRFPFLFVFCLKEIWICSAGLLYLFERNIVSICFWRRRRWL